MKLSRKSLLWVLLTSVLGVLVFNAFRSFTIQQVAKAQVRVVPFLIEMHIYNFEVNRQGELYGIKKMARSSDGVIADVETFGLVSWGLTKRNLRYPDGRSVQAIDWLKIKTSWRISDPRLIAVLKQRLQASSPNCAGDSSARILRDELILNHPALVVSQPVAENHQMTFWKAPDLGCATLQYRVELKQPDGSLRLRNDAKAVLLDLQEPDASFFDPGTDYEEVKPSELEHRVSQKLGLPDDPTALKMLGLQDQRYLSERQ